MPDQTAEGAPGSAPQSDVDPSFARSGAVRFKAPDASAPAHSGPTARSPINGAVSRSLSLDLGRIYGCLSVIILHQGAPNFGNAAWAIDIADQLARWAVPFFFITAGYFAPRSDVLRKTVQRIATRIAPIFAAWALFYLAIDGDPSTSFRMLLSPFEFFKFLLYGGPGFHLWFLTSLAACALLFSALQNILSLRTILLIAAALYIIGLLFGSYYVAWTGQPVFEPYDTHLFPFMGFLFYAIGFALRKHPQEIFAPLFLIAGGVALSAAEIGYLYFVHGVDIIRHNFVLGTLPFGVGMFLFFQNLPPPAGFQATLARHIGPVTLGVYASHLFFLGMLTTALQPHSLPAGAGVAILTFALSCATAYAGGQIPVLRRVFR